MFVVYHIRTSRVALGQLGIPQCRSPRSPTVDRTALREHQTGGSLEVWHRCLNYPPTPNPTPTTIIIVLQNTRYTNAGKRLIRLPGALMSSPQMSLNAIITKKVTTGSTPGAGDVRRRRRETLSIICVLRDAHRPFCLFSWKCSSLERGNVGLPIVQGRQSCR